MQYVGRAIGSVSKTWSSINPATLSGGIDVIVVEHDDGTLSCSPFHVRFGKFQLLRPSQKKVAFIVNGVRTDLPMKLGDGGEAFFVFEATNDVDIPEYMATSPVLSAASSPSTSPRNSPSRATPNLAEPEFLDIGRPATEPIPIHRPVTPEKLAGSPSRIHTATTFTNTPILHTPTIHRIVASPTAISLDYSTSPPKVRELAIERAQRLTKKLNIPSKIDVNGDLVMDMEGYKSSDKNIDDSNEVIKQLLKEEFGEEFDVANLLKEDEKGNYRINYSTDDLINDGETTPSYLMSPSPAPTDLTLGTGGSSAGTDLDIHSPSAFHTAKTNLTDESATTATSSTPNYFKTLRLTSDQLKCLNLAYGENSIGFSVDKGKAVITSRLFLWKSNIPIVISDIDGTITKSDALGHVLNLIGRDWTHVGVAKLFSDIHSNGYNIMYLTARSVGLADSTRTYLNGINQGGLKLPVGPVILTPDRTMAALRREVILKKPEVFKMAALSDIKSLYDNLLSNKDLKSPFYAGFGNRITDALSYRYVNIPSSRIFTINPDGDVHMELLELAGVKTSYLHIGELVDQFFPPVNSASNKDVSVDERFTDVNFWREPLVNLSDLSEEDDDIQKEKEKVREREKYDGVKQGANNESFVSAVDYSLKNDSMVSSSNNTYDDYEDEDDEDDEDYVDEDEDDEDDDEEDDEYEDEYEDDYEEDDDDELDHDDDVDYDDELLHQFVPNEKPSSDETSSGLSDVNIMDLNQEETISLSGASFNNIISKRKSFTSVDNTEISGENSVEILKASELIEKLGLNEKGN